MTDRNQTGHRLIETGDGTKTLHHAAFGENTHTRYGAYTESLYRHVYPSLALDKGGEITVLDIGFGLGYNILALITESAGRKNITRITVHSFEYDQNLAAFLDEIRFGDKRDKMYDKIRLLYSRNTYEDGSLSLHLHFGDARSSLRTLMLQENSIDAVFHDPHSPGKNSELWTTEFFRLLYPAMKVDALLTTYSSALHIRHALLEAGFFIFPNRDSHFSKEGTLAGKAMYEYGFQAEYLENLVRTVKSTPFHD
ncbi:MAG: tRNA (5-methylaminomethyl-2-thiouridine)(34)-methyltransferase MnmD, partial [Spirochaetota bacterium]